MLRIVRTVVAVAMLIGTAARGDLTYRAFAPGIERAEVTFNRSADAPPMTIWIYRPAAKMRAGSFPCVFIAPAGATGVTGMKLSAEDATEHVPYVSQGFVVVAYEVDGAVERGVGDAAFVDAVGAFVKADGGIANLRAAIDRAEHDEPAIDGKRLYVAGHSSAGTLALRAAAECGDTIRGAVAYAPASDLVTRIGAAAIEGLDAAAPGVKQLLTDRQPIAEAASIRCPTMLFHAIDDNNVPIAETRALAAKMKDAGNPPLVMEAATGGHYDAMLLKGLDAGAAWLADRAKRDAEKH